MYRKMSLNNQKGQVLLIVVLIMVVALTVGLSVVSRTITSLRTSTEQVNSQKALSAAEAGVEQQLLNTNVSIGNKTIGTTSYNTTIASVSGTSPFLLNGGNLVQKDDGAYIWITPFSSNPANLWQNPWNGTLTIYWGSTSDICSQNPATNTAAALEVTVIYNSRANPLVSRYALDSCSRGNGFSVVSPSLAPEAGRNFDYQYSIPITNGLLVRVTVLYASTYLAAYGGGNALPSQGSVVSSLGTSDNSQRKISVFQGYPEIPSELFPYSVFSP